MTRKKFREGLFELDPIRLVGGRCARCGVHSFPMRDVCPGCRNAGDVSSVKLSTTGTIHTYTIVRQAPPGTSVPYVLAYVDLPEEVRVMAQVIARNLEDIQIGRQVTLVERLMPTDQTGQQAVGYQFELAATGSGQ